MIPLVFCVLLITVSESFEVDKTFIFSTDIVDAKNWMDDGSMNCTTLQFPPYIPFTHVDHWSVQKVVLPADGVVYVPDGNEIVFDEKNSLCLRIKEMDYHSWFDTRSWSSGDFWARPNLEKLPCSYDFVEFPYGENTAVLLDVGVDIVVKGIVFGKKHLTPQQFSQLTIQLYRTTRNDNWLTYFDCKDPTGCTCHREASVGDAICAHLRQLPTQQEPSCLEPIEPIGHCSHHKTCGATIVFKYDPGSFNFEEFLKIVPEANEVDSYVSKVWFGSEELIQVVFADVGVYKGSSVKLAADFYLKKFTDKNFRDTQGILEPTLAASGPPVTVGNKLKEITWTVLGTFFFAIFIISIIFTYYYGNVRQRLTNWVPTNRLVVPYSSIKYSGGDNESVAFGAGSLAGSVLSLENPLYGQQSTSTSSTTLEDKKSIYDNQSSVEEKSDLGVENPMFEMSLRSLEEDVTGNAEE